MSAIVTTAKETPPPVAADDLWTEAGYLRCTLSVDLPLRLFTVRDLLQLEPGAILESNHVNGADVPVVVNTQLIAWAEFEVVAQRIAVRVTELA
ncbi:MAG TPA: FliM/FliN family flagellar motor C-terminal domain-containing protein [Candidatus Acidoferrum sp.]|nr:FliM/FliN family flagellar motor C-terminal domain-containing protein [Candidatus Acidoferrum sp.]